MTEQQLQRAKQIKADIDNLKAQIDLIKRREDTDICVRFTVVRTDQTGFANADLHIDSILSEDIMKLILENLEASLSEKENDFKDL